MLQSSVLMCSHCWRFGVMVVLMLLKGSVVTLSSDVSSYITRIFSCEILVMSVAQIEQDEMLRINVNPNLQNQK